jgi:hypothetical protein
MVLGKMTPLMMLLPETVRESVAVTVTVPALPVPKSLLSILDPPVTVNVPAFTVTFPACPLVVKAVMLDLSLNCNAPVADTNTSPARPVPVPEEPFDDCMNPRPPVAPVVGFAMIISPAILISIPTGAPGALPAVSAVIELSFITNFPPRMSTVPPPVLEVLVELTRRSDLFNRSTSPSRVKVSTLRAGGCPGELGMTSPADATLAI